MNLFYGISIPKEKNKKDIIQSIIDKGLNVNQGDWNPEKKRKRFLSKNEISHYITQNTKEALDSILNENKEDITFATADFESANYYAMKHNKKNDDDIGLVIEFTANIEDIIIDGNDLLSHPYVWECTNEEALSILSDIYSPKIREYISLALNSSNVTQKQIISLAAMQDRDMVLGHLKNELPVELGLYIPSKTHLCVKSPIMPENIVEVHDGSNEILVPELKHSVLQSICQMKNT